jgi:site-specific recombinase XerD
MVNAKAATPAAANTFRKLLSVLKRVAIDAGWRKDNPVATVKGIRTKSDGFRTWTDEEIAAFRARHEVGTKPRLALELLLCTGQRRGDAVRREREACHQGTPLAGILATPGAFRPSAGKCEALGTYPGNRRGLSHCPAEPF